MRSAWQLGMGCGLVLCSTIVSWGRDPDRVVNVWPEMAPGETTHDVGTALPTRATEQPPATRVGGIMFPTLSFYNPPAENNSGAVALILPGGGYNYVVVDKEGSEIAEWLNRQGVTGVVLRYRTKDKSTPMWQRPLQDAQRAVSVLRAQAEEQKFDPKRIGVIGFSAGGNLAALTATRFDTRAYPAVDAVDAISCRPDFAMLIYPWKLLDETTRQLSGDFPITKETPPTFLVHTHDDSSTSMGSLWFYAGLKERKIPAELHVYQAGGHGYGLRPVSGTSIHKWVEPAAEWLKQQKIVPAEINTALEPTR